MGDRASWMALHPTGRSVPKWTPGAVVKPNKSGSKFRNSHGLILENGRFNHTGGPCYWIKWDEDGTTSSMWEGYLVLVGRSNEMVNKELKDAHDYYNQLVAMGEELCS